MKTIVSLCLLTLAALLGNGCIATEKTNYRDEARLPVSFENETAGRLFYEALSKAGTQDGRRESKTEICIPIVFEHTQRTVDGENVGFNAAVRRCDTNADGKITELEARIYAESVCHK